MFVATYLRLGERVDHGRFHYYSMAIPYCSKNWQEDVNQMTARYGGTNGAKDGWACTG